MPKSSFNKEAIDVDPISSATILKALDGLSARAAATASNIANSNSPGYRALSVSFEDALVAAARQGPGAVATVRPAVTEDASAAGIRLDLELATAASTASRYGALLDLLGRQMKLHSLAVTGGR